MIDYLMKFRGVPRRGKQREATQNKYLISGGRPLKITVLNVHKLTDCPVCNRYKKSTDVQMLRISGGPHKQRKLTTDSFKRASGKSEIKQQ
jgi:hypothetical protein